MAVRWGRAPTKVLTQNRGIRVQVRLAGSPEQNVKLKIAASPTIVWGAQLLLQLLLLLWRQRRRLLLLLSRSQPTATATATAKAAAATVVQTLAPPLRAAKERVNARFPAHHPARGASCRIVSTAR